MLAGGEDLMKVLAAFAITAAGGLLLDLGGFELPETATPVALSLIAGGVLFIVIEQRLKPNPSALVTWPMVVAVGLAQIAAAAFPGLSRSGASIIALLVLGLSRPAATEFSFIVGIPTLLAAGGWKILRSVTDGGGAAGERWSMVAIATVVSAVVSFAAVKWMLGYIRSHTFTGFGWYRIALGALLLILLLPR
jgi:undecaprenyl-diphosphatase